MSKNPPDGWPQITPSVFYDDPRQALEWLARAFGFETRVKVEGPDGQILHSELVFGGGLVMVGGTAGSAERKSPRALGGANTQALYVFVDNVDAHCARARAAGARILSEPGDKDYGDRIYLAEDCEGHRWWFGQRVDDGAAEESRRPHRTARS